MRRFLNLLVLAVLLLLPLPALASDDARTDSLCAAGAARLRAKDPRAAADLFKQAVALNPDRARTHLLIGRAYLGGGDPDRAVKAFKTALAIDAASAEAQAGVGEAYYLEAATGFKATLYARRATSAARRATQLDPDYAPAYLLLGRCHERFDEDLVKALHAYQKALDLRPDDLDAAYSAGAAYVELMRRRRSLRDIPAELNEATFRRLNRRLGEPRFLPIAAQIYLYRGEPENALEAFERYIGTLKPEEAQVYRDIAPVASRSEVEACARASGEARGEFLRQFWARRDPDLLTDVNERLIEHYRRVWYARNLFGQNKIPWDRRGEVYVRYGDPDYRARSDRHNLLVPARVAEVKERLALELYGTGAIDETFIGPVFPVRSARSFVGNLDPRAQPGPEGQDTERLESAGPGLDEGVYREQTPEEFHAPVRPDHANHFLPVTTKGDMSVVPWESWVYTEVGAGIEITFTDERGDGVYDYAPIPAIPEQEGHEGLAQFTRYTQFAPSVLASRAIASAPDAFVPGGPRAGLGFYYDRATFRGKDGKTRLEVYYGLDPKEMEKSSSGDTSAILADCAFVLTDSAFSQAHRAHDAMVFRAKGPLWGEGAFIPDMVALDVPPGDYDLTVQVKDRVGDRTGVYRERIRVEPYGEGRLQLSDVHLGWNISTERGEEKFRKGDLWIVPMTTKAYREDQSAYVYYEVYNLTQDRDGKTRYRISYAIRAEDPKRPFNPIRSGIGGIGKLFGSGGAQVSVSYDQAGAEPRSSGHFELNLKKARPGLNRLTVTVEDRASGQTASKDVLFRYKK
ncbi:MAG: hypothetical protein A3F84_01210 [Candidatus Handelsmanbacteria bacterium RIFCSPLOWO2_12_FULL_64_10]|uniref:Uncharacterized protein n=1 Tax=Handelsmanbacteria sp. (strain RIFCSPLOWO2_12_FULL_64_10) TaxID=1817868 RepID=A0A1F6CA82_HANXR|nr:MAG: hypothetical protein A3F84_01210 [Candidatus Handelsmanbacteria bacterium RIFCSPLOWO2_12_FULL_64_10]